MFDIIFGWRKASKCKKLIKMLKNRLKLLRNKRCCILKHLRGDMAELLKHGHHQTAFERVEQLIMDERMVQLYELLDQFCDFILFHLPYIRKSRDCPNDINEAVSTLIFSSARSGELPELMSIRKLFGERYGQRFVINAIELRPGNLVNDQIKENLYIKKVSDDLKYRLLGEIASSCMQQGPLFLEYKPELQQDHATEASNQLSCREVQMHNNYEAEAMGKEQILPNAIQNLDTGGQKSTKPADCNEMDKFTITRGESYTCGMEIESYSESSAVELPEDIIYLDAIQEIVSPVTKDGNLQDQRLFVFKPFGTIPLNEKSDYEIDINLEDHQNLTEEWLVSSRSSTKMSKKRSRRRSVPQENRIVPDIECVTYCGESETSPDYNNNNKCRPHYQKEHKNEILVQDFPLLSLKEGKQIQQYGLRAMTMPAERPNNESLTYNNIRSISFPDEQPCSRYSSCRHIHPKLPDYDELAAKFKALKRANLQNEYQLTNLTI